MSEIDITTMTREELEAIPRAEYDVTFECESLIVLPGEPATRGEKSRLTQNKQDWEKDDYLHDSGYRCMSFIALDKKAQPLGRIGGCSDVIHVDGIGGYGYKWTERTSGVPTQVPVSAWMIDCLPRSGLLRIFRMGGGGILCEVPFSSFSIYRLGGRPR